MMDEPAFLRIQRRRHRSEGDPYAVAKRRAMTDLLRAKLGLPAVEVQS